MAGRAGHRRDRDGARERARARLEPAPPPAPALSEGLPPPGGRLPRGGPQATACSFRTPPLPLRAQGDPQAFADYQAEYRNTICGRHPIGVLLNVGAAWAPLRAARRPARAQPPGRRRAARRAPAPGGGPTSAPPPPPRRRCWRARRRASRWPSTRMTSPRAARAPPTAASATRRRSWCRCSGAGPGVRRRRRSPTARIPPPLVPLYPPPSTAPLLRAAPIGPHASLRTASAGM